MAQGIEKDLLELRKLETEVGKVTANLQDYALKKHENETVKQEFESIAEGSKVFKMIGPALIPQDLNEAKSTVNKRLEFIDREISKLTKLKEESMKRIEEKQTKVMKFQEEIQKKQHK